MTALYYHRYRRGAERKDAANAGEVRRCNRWFLGLPRGKGEDAAGAGCRQDGRQGCGGLAALGGQGAGTEKRGEEAVQQGERKEV